MKTAAKTRAAGFTTFELLISMALVVLALTLAAQMLLESQRTFALAGRAALEPMTGAAVARLTADVHAASGIKSALDGALLLTSHPERVVRWEQEGDTIWRTVIGAGSAIRSHQPVLERVTEWSWNWDGALLTTTLAYRRGSTLRYVTTPGLPPETAREERLTLQLHPRGRGRWNRW